MRRTTFQTFHRTSVLTVSAAAALLLAGCGGKSDSGAAGSGPASPSRPASTAPSSPSSPSTGPTGAPSGSAPGTPTGKGCAPQLQLSAADKGHTVCLTKGGRIRLELDGTKDRPWTPVKATGGVLKATNAGVAIQRGDAVAAFDAVAPGTVQLTATRPLCAKHPGQVSCLGIEQWTVTVTVAKP
ncbi:hypothetical protein ABZ845_22275 [Streptomyces sp. NPDC047022]|uniref:hypothetical protein n=1 Tax=Streptomyces sp. NPDC047022 TaxID=3155737 RepID=UPI0033EB3BCB